MKPFLVTICLIFCLAGCDTGNKDDCIVPPDPFNFKIIDKYSRKDLVYYMTPVYDPDSIRMFYFHDGEQFDLPIHTTLSRHQYDIFSNETVPYLSALETIKDYYLQLNCLEIDTLLIDVREIDLESCTVFEYDECYINGKPMNTRTDDGTVFLVKK
jgi:hypothetical protein